MINKTTYQIEMCTDGKHRVIVTFEDPAGSKAAIAAARGIYSQLLRDEDLAEPSEQATPLDRDEPPICGVHHVPMVLVNGRKGPFWSCHEKNLDGSWCSYRPTSR
jgi:hypothetical protein